MVERSGCSVEESSNGASLHDGSTNANSILKHSYQPTQINNNPNNNNNNNNNNRFSIFKWFKRSASERPSNHQQIINDDQNVSEVSSSESVDTYYSTATVKSFAFQSGTLGPSSAAPINVNVLQENQRSVGPFASGASKVIGKIGNDSTNVTQTLPANVLSRSRNITTRYSLQSCTTGIGSCNNVNTNHQRGLANSLRQVDNRPGERRLHVRGKRRAPNPPGTNPRPKSVCITNAVSGSGQRKRRPAPKPPEAAIIAKNSVENGMDVGDGAGDDENRIKTKNLRANAQSFRDTDKFEEAVELNINQQSISNDTLVLRGGVLLSKRETKAPIKLLTTGPSGATSLDAGHQRNSVTVGSPGSSAMPRPWYKRSVFENSSKKMDNTRGPVSSGIRDDPGNNSSTLTSTTPNHNHHQSEKSPNEGSLSRLKFFNRDKNSDDKRKEIKRRSGLTILTNISELDKEAAAIVQEEQARTRALLMKQTLSVNDGVEKRTDSNQQEVIQDMVTSAMESSPRRGTRALISKFNAIGNITKVTVNSSFFNKNTCAKSASDSKVTGDNWRSKITPETNPKVHPDLSRYFPQRGNPKTRRDIESGKSSMDTSRFSFLRGTNDNITVKKHESIVQTKVTNEQHHNLMSDVTNRLSALQSVVTKNSFDNFKRSSPIASRSVLKSRQESIIDDDNSGDVDTKKVSSCHENSPKVLRTRAFATDGEKKAQKIDAIQREFTNIFEAMDKQQLNSTNLKPSNHRLDNEKKHQQVGTSSQVSKVLDILVETQKIGRDSWLESNQKSEIKPKTPLLLNKIEDPTTMDLKEMLKEMKHSLPKRPKPKRTTDEKIFKTNTDQIKEPNSSNSYLLNHVKVIYPPIIHIAPSQKLQLTKEEQQHHCVKQQHKVSSAVQTSGNVRRVITNSLTSSSTTATTAAAAAPAATPSSPSSSSFPSTSQWKFDDIIYKTMRNKFQLMRPREFAAIGAIKTMKSSKSDDNTYANVIEQSLYANALVLPSRNHQIIPNNIAYSDNKIKCKLPVPHDDQQFHFDDDEKEEMSAAAAAAASPSPFGYLQAVGNKGDNSRVLAMAQQKMNTVAVNRLIKKLEGAIASGNHQKAAGFAKDLARLKIQCSVIRHRPKNGNLVNVDMYIEDRLAHQGPIPLQLPLLMTVAQLKDKISNDFDIPANVQRWIINNTLAENNDATLVDLHAIEGSPVFLYLVAPDLQIIDPAKQPILALDPNNAAQFIEKDDNNVDEIIIEEPEKYIDNINDDNGNNDKVLPKDFDPVADNPALVIELVNNDNHELPEDLKLINVVQSNVKLNQSKIKVKNVKKENIEVIDDIEEEEGAVALIKKIEPEEYQELIMLESCDIVPNTDSIECPICFLKYGPFEGVLLRGCLHAFCRVCLVNTIKHCEDAEVKCPYGDAIYSCESAIQEREIKALVDPDVYELHLAKSISQAESSAGENAFHCKTPDCGGWCLYDDKPNHFLCPVCDKTNCLTCRVIHEGQNCLEYQEDIRLSKETDHESKRTAAMLANMLDRGEAMNCPTCNVLLMKKMGCDWLKCSMCKTEICWVTKGPRWGAGGPGDISGGCKCNVNGTKCHPNCNYCH